MTRYILLFALFLSSCYRVTDNIEPRINYKLLDQHFDKLSSAFPHLSPDERSTDWGREYIIARHFSQELDLYRAVSTFKRALISCPLMKLAASLKSNTTFSCVTFLGSDTMKLSMHLKKAIWPALTRHSLPITIFS